MFENLWDFMRKWFKRTFTVNEEPKTLTDTNLIQIIVVNEGDLTKQSGRHSHSWKELKWIAEWDALYGEEVRDLKGYTADFGTAYECEECGRIIIERRRALY